MKKFSFQNDVLPLKDKLFRLALRITLNRQDAEDIVQETLLRMWKTMRNAESGTGEAIDNLEAFALTTCRNLSLDLGERMEHRNISFDSEQHDQAADSTWSPYERLVSDERYTQLNRLVNALPEKQRTALQLRDMEGRSYREIAEVMQISESDVKINIFRARKKIKESWITNT